MVLCLGLHRSQIHHNVTLTLNQLQLNSQSLGLLLELLGTRQGYHRFHPCDEGFREQIVSVP